MCVSLTNHHPPFFSSRLLESFVNFVFRSRSSAEPLPLMDLCRRAARLALGRDRLQEIESLPLPQSLKNYLQYQWLTPAVAHADRTIAPDTFDWRDAEDIRSERQSSAKVGFLKGWRGRRWRNRGSPGQHQLHLDLHLLFFFIPLLTGNKWLMMVSRARNQSPDSTVALLPPGGGNKKTAPRKHTNPGGLFEQVGDHIIAAGYHSVYLWTH